MKLIKNEIWLHYRDFVECGIYESDKALREARSRGVRSKRFMDDPDDNRIALVHYDSLLQRDKDKLIAHFSDLMEHINFEPLRKLITRDLKAEQFYMSYTLNNGEKLPGSAVEKYIKAAEFLNMLIKVQGNKELLKPHFKSLFQFFETSINLIKREEIELPKTYRNLPAKVRLYKQNGYECLIEKWRYQNLFAAKVNDEVSASMLLELLSDERMFDDVQTMRHYNSFAIENGYQPITDASVGVWRRKNDEEIRAFRNGRSNHYNIYGKVILGKRPSAPMLKWENDGNNWDAYFQAERLKSKNGNNSVQVYNYNTFVLVIVIDCFNDYIIGWSMGLTETKDLIHAAILDAITNVKLITGNYYLPHGLGNDRFGLSGLEQLYKNLCPGYFPTAAKSARSKYIERSFGQEWHSVLRYLHNYSGFNITAKTRTNADRIERNLKNNPHTSEAFFYVSSFIKAMRDKVMNETTGITRERQWIEAFNNSEKSKENLITDEQALWLFGIRNDRQQTISSKGITVQMFNSKYSYVLSNEDYLGSVGKQVNMIFNPHLMDTVLITDGNKYRKLAYAPDYIPRAKADFTELDEKRYWKMMSWKKTYYEDLMARKEQRENVLRVNGLDALEYAKSGMIAPKEFQRAIENVGQIEQNIGYNQPTQEENNIDPIERLLNKM